MKPKNFFYATFSLALMSTILFTGLGYYQSIPVYAETYNVTTLSLSGPGSLSEAVEFANLNPGEDIIRFDLEPNQVDELGNPVVVNILPQESLPISIVVSDEVVIDGAVEGPNGQTLEHIINGSLTLFPLFNVIEGGDLTLRNFTFQGFGSIGVVNTGRLQIENSVITSENPSYQFIAGNSADVLIQDTFFGSNLPITAIDSNVRFIGNVVSLEGTENTEPLLNLTRGDSFIESNLLVGEDGSLIFIENIPNTVPAEINTHVIQNNFMRINTNGRFVDITDQERDSVVISENNYNYTGNFEGNNSQRRSTILDAVEIIQNQLFITGSTIFPELEFYLKTDDPSTPGRFNVTFLTGFNEGSAEDFNLETVASLPDDPAGSVRNAFTFVIPLPVGLTETSQLTFIESITANGAAPSQVTEFAPFADITDPVVYYTFDFEVNTDGSGEIRPNDQVRMIASITNLSADNVFPDAFLTFSLPEGITINPNQTSDAFFFDPSTNLWVWEAGDIAANDTVSFIFDGTVAPNTGGQLLPYTVNLDSSEEDFFFFDDSVNTISGVIPISLPNTITPVSNIEVTPVGGNSITQQPNNTPTNPQVQTGTSLRTGGGNTMLLTMGGVFLLLSGISVAISYFHFAKK